MPLFIPGKTKLTGLLRDEKYAQNSGIWTPVDDIKLSWAQIAVTNSSAALSVGDGYNDIALPTAGIFTVDYSSPFDAIPASFGMCVISSADADQRIFCIVEDGTVRRG